VLLVNWSGSTISGAISPASYLNTLIFVLAFFSFSQVVFQKSIPDRRALALVGVISSIFCFLHFGVNIFSFVRYYAMAPVMLNLVLFFTMMAIAIWYFDKEKLSFKYLATAALVTVAAAYIHLQEVLFAAALMLVMSLYAFLYQNLGFIRGVSGDGRERISIYALLTDRINLAFIASFLAMLFFVFYSYSARERNPAVEPKLISLGDFLPFANDFYILNPTYQFYYVITLWGLLVYLLFMLNWKQLRSNTYIVAGMVSPLFTIFNPVFTDLFLRYSLTEMYWRLSFIVPLYLVAGYVVVRMLTAVREKSARGLVASVTAVLMLLVLLFPIHTRYIDAPYSRMLTLGKLSEGSTPTHWQDLIGYLDSVKRRDSRIITDPVTGYMLSALTRHTSLRKKFHRFLAGYIRLNYESYVNHPFDRYRGHMLIINRRDGAISESGRVARHWPENILKVSNYYPAALIDYLAENPQRFELQWDSGDIQVYRIMGSPAAG
jgi:hypothetical protein